MKSEAPYPRRTATENGFQNKLALRQDIESRALKRRRLFIRRLVSFN